MPDKLAVLQAQVIINDLKNVENAAKSLNNTFKDTVKQTDKITKAFNTGRIREYTAAIRELNSVTTQYTNIERQLASSLERTARLELQQARLATEQARARTELARAAREESQARQQERREAQAEERENRNGSSAYRQLIRDRNEARTRARDYGAQMILLNRSLRDGTITEREYRQQLAELSVSFRNSSRDAVQLDRDFRRLNQSTNAGNHSGALPGRVTDILKALGVTSIIDNVASSFYKLGKSYYDTSLKLETLHLAQKSIFKTNEEVGRQNEFLTGIAQKYGIELVTLSQAYNNFSASAQGTTLEGEKSKVIFDAVSKSSAMLGVTTDDTNGILRALGQMMSKGKVQAEELRGQLGDRMAGAFRLFADGMGVSTAELDKMLKKGEVIAEDVLPKFAEQLNKKYKLGIGDEIETTQASLNRLTNAWTIFVDSVEKKSLYAGTSISNLTDIVTGLLKELTPSSFINDIKQQQLEFNKLGLELRKNWNDTKKRKDLLDQMIAINPNFIDGLNKEKATLEQIQERLRLTNDQYARKILLQKNMDKMNEILDEELERVQIIAAAEIEHSVAINNLSTAQRKLYDDMLSGKITYFQARSALKELGNTSSETQGVFLAMSTAMNRGTITSKGFIGSTKELAKEADRLNTEHNAQLKVLDKLFKSSGNMLGINTSLMNSNYMLGGSYDFLRQKQDLADRKQNEDYQKAINRARALKIAYAEFNGFFFDAKTAKNTGKKVGEWDLINNKLVKRVPQKTTEDPKKYTGAKLDGYQKDFLMKAQGARDMEMANLEKSRLELNIGEEDYWKEKQKIVERYNSKIQGYLKGANAKEIQVQGAAYKKAVDAAVQSNKELYDFRSKNLEENFKKEFKLTERESKNLEQEKTLNDEERLNKQIEIDGKMINQISDYYKSQIDLAKKSAQSTIELERQRDEEIGKIEDQRLQRVTSLPEALIAGIENQSAITQSKVEANFEDQKAIILKDKSLSADQRAYKLSQLDKKLQIEKNKEEISRLDLLHAQILAQQVLRSMKGQTVTLTPEEEKALKEYEATIKSLQNANRELGDEKNSEVAPVWLKTKDYLVKGFQDMGMSNFAATVGDQFDDLYKKIIEGSLSAKDAVMLAASLMADGLSSMVNSQKEKTIAALDEQLKYSQETTEQEVGFINSRLEALNSLEDLTAEQITERNRLEDEARTYQEQQRQREKLIETQKARAEQKAAAQQALINGALAATMTLAQMGFIAGAIPAALALGFGIAQSIAIMSKDPVPKYWMGRKGGKAEFAIKDEMGPEIHTDKNDNILSFGSKKGANKVWLNEGDKIYTASESTRILKTMGVDAKIGSKIYRKAARESMIAPQVSVVNNYKDNSDAIARKVTKGFDQVMFRYTHPTTEYVGGTITRYTGANYGVVVGYYDEETGKPIRK
ncbi:tape measure protein [Chryseobacterium bernardetii]|uniref:tape measure protein n=1 Tax=Chryseobacterium bernardetii TaxID=1241978 RepID=UPI001623E965|nr:tape measure protein [Chryseobacterium bernardetii]